MPDEDLESRRRLRIDLQEFLRAEWGEGALRVESLEPFGGGHSGFTYRVSVVGAKWEGPAILRTSPPGVRIAGPADIERQARVLSAVARAGVPVPRVLAKSPDVRIDGRSFMLTELVDGVGWEAGRGPAGDRGVAGAAVGVLKLLRAIPPHLTGLGEEEPFSPSAEIERWARLLERAPDSMRSDGATLREELLASAPEGTVGLVHGDYHYGNLLYRSGKVAAVLDWEIAELGDPRMDLGSLAVSSLRRQFAPVPNSMGSVAVTLDELCELYGTTRGQARWFVAASCYKYAAIFAYNLMLHRSGRRPDDHYELLLDTMRGLLVVGRDFVRADSRSGRD